MDAPSSLPPLYARWMGALFGGAVPGEPRATCDSCAMCARPGEPAAEGATFYSPSTKCCTYLPALANFLVGRVLGDDSAAAAEGRRTVEARIDAKLEVTPLGLGRTRLFTLLYAQSPGGFGHAQALLCPHYLAGGRCGVWQHRESTCATWFCKHERGAVGKTFWRRLHELLLAAETAVSRACLLDIGIDRGSLERLFPPIANERGGPGLSAAELDGVPDEPAYATLWGRWAGRERELYRRAAAIVDDLSWPQVLAKGGAELEVLAHLARAAYADLANREPPARVRHKPLKVLYTSPTRARLATYSPLDPLALPRTLVDVLHRFDGGDTSATLATIAAEDGLRLAPAVVRKLVDFAILEPVAAGGEGDADQSD
jgi:hypothetical protein